METEEWKDIPGYADYQISNLGNVKSLSRYILCNNGKIKNLKEKILKLKLNKDGSFRIGLYSGDRQIFHQVSRLVANSFVENSFNKECVIHLDRDNKNNSYTNLSWASWEEVREIASLSIYLSHKNYKLNNHLSKKCTLTINDKQVTYDSVSEASRQNNTSVTSIFRKLKRNKQNNFYV